MTLFPTSLYEIERKVKEIDPRKYASTRNYKDGQLTYLGPYISRGILSTKGVFKQLSSSGLPFSQMEKLVQELAWRDFWQRIWCHKNEAINSFIKQAQAPIANHLIPKSIVEAKTGIIAVDQEIEALKENGYLHNHMRMYVSSIACNVAHSHWLIPAKWMYSQLLDGDWGSNALSWQWVAGSNSSKKYYANQDNINTFFFTKQQNTFLDIPYEEFPNLTIPKILTESQEFVLKTPLPETELPEIDPEKRTLVYNYYNLDPYWHKNEDVNRILLLEPSIFSDYPINKNCIDFMMLLKNNIPNIKIFVGEFFELKELCGSSEIIYKEHPLNNKYQGTEEVREWLFEAPEKIGSFFKFWKHGKKQLEFD